MSRFKVIVKGNVSDAALEAAAQGLRYEESSYTARETIGYVTAYPDSAECFLAARVMTWYSADGLKPGSLLWFGFADSQ